MITHADVVFVAHYVGGGINDAMDIDSREFFSFLDAALELYKLESERPVRAILAGIEKKK